MDRDGNRPGVIRSCDAIGSRIEQDKAALTPWGGLSFTFMLAEFFQDYAASIAAKG
jgi:hypothetical protein